MKKIFILLRDITESGGGERVCANLANAFSKDFLKEDSKIMESRKDSKVDSMMESKDNSTKDSKVDSIIESKEISAKDSKVDSIMKSKENLKEDSMESKTHFDIESKAGLKENSNIESDLKVDSKNTEYNNYEVEIISFFKTFEKPIFDISPNVKITYLSNLSAIKGGKFKRLLSKTFWRFFLSFKAIKYIKNCINLQNLDSKSTQGTQDSTHLKNAKKASILANDGTFIPLFKIKNAKLLRLWHIKPPKKKKKIFDKYDTLIVLSKNDLQTWERYHKNVKVIPNFLPSFPPLQSLKNFAKSYENPNFSQDFNQADSIESSKDSNKTDSTDSIESSHENNTKNKKIVLAAGRFTPEKGFSRLIDMFSKIAEQNRTNWELHIVGDGKLKVELESQISLLKMQDCIKILPFSKNMERHYANADIYALSSFHEGFGMVVLEAQSFGLPCVAFECVARELFSDKSGFLIPQDDTQQFAQKLELLMQDCKLRKKMGQNARILVQTSFSKEAILTLWHEVL